MFFFSLLCHNILQSYILHHCKFPKSDWHLLYLALRLKFSFLPKKFFNNYSLKEIKKFKYLDMILFSALHLFGLHPYTYSPLRTKISCARADEDVTTL